MSLTPKQQEFLDKYVRKYRPEFLTKGKKERAKSFGKMREELQQAMLNAPPDLPQYAELLRAMREADEWGEKLKFNHASELMKATLGELQEAIKSRTLQEDPSEKEAAEPQAVEQLLNRLKKTTESKEFKDPQVRRLAKELDFPINKASDLLTAKNVSQKDFAWAEHLVDEVESKLVLILDERDRIEKTKVKLKKYFSLAEEREDITSGDGFKQLKGEVEDLLLMDGWTRTEQSTATTVHLKLMLALANGTQTQQKDLKEGHTEMVLAVRRKSPKSGEDDGKQDPNFKVLVKPAQFEIDVPGFKQGGGAPREAMGSFLGNELQRMAGLKLGVPDTSLVTLDGEYLMGNSVGKEGKKTFSKGQKVLASVQSFEQGCLTISARNEDLNIGFAPLLDKLVPKEELQQMAVFDLISLNTDRHGNNVMLDGDDKLVPIDHGNIMPTKKGIRVRGGALHSDSTSALFAKTAAANEKLTPELIECIERLDIDGLVLSMKAQSRQMKMENDEVDVTDLNEGVENVRRSAAFMKYAARTLTLKEIYDALAEHPDLIFFSKDERSAFKRVVDSIKNSKNAKQMLPLVLGLAPDQPVRDVRDALRRKLASLNWFTTSPSDGRINVVTRRYPERVMEILGEGAKLPFSGNPQQRYMELGGDDAAKRIAAPISSEIDLELFYFTTGEMP